MRTLVRAVGVLGLVASTLGCVKATQPGAQSTERQSEAEYDVARDYFYKGQPRMALDHSMKALSLDSENAKALYFTSVIYLSFCASSFESPDCRLSDAEKFARKTLEVEDGFRDARNLLGQILILEKRPKDAIAVLEPLTRDMAYTANHLAWGNLGWAQVQLGDLKSGIASLKNAVTQPRFCVGHYRLGVAYERQGEMHLAEESYTRALSVESPDCEGLQDAWEARGHVRKKLGRIDDARADFEKCRDLGAQTKLGRACTKELRDVVAVRE